MEQMVQLNRLRISRFPTWMDVEIGTCGSNNEMLVKMSKVPNCIIGDTAHEVLESAIYLPPKRIVRLVKVSAFDLGFGVVAKQSELYNRAFDRGFRPAPLELAPHLRIKYLNQPDGEWLRLGAYPVRDKYGKWRVLTIYCEFGQLYLHATSADPETEYVEGDREWIFLQAE
jgi:hypothetical protein